MPFAATAAVRRLPKAPSIPRNRTKEAKTFVPMGYLTGIWSGSHVSIINLLVLFCKLCVTTAQKYFTFANQS